MSHPVGTSKQVALARWVSVTLFPQFGNIRVERAHLGKVVHTCRRVTHYKATPINLNDSVTARSVALLADYKARMVGPLQRSDADHSRR